MFVCKRLPKMKLSLVVYFLILSYFIYVVETLHDYVCDT
jgi:hypothetical protein